MIVTKGKENRDKYFDKFSELATNTTKIYSSLGKPNDPLKKYEPEEGEAKETDPKYAHTDSIRKKELFIGIEKTDKDGNISDDLITDEDIKPYSAWRIKTYNKFEEIDKQVGLFPIKIDLKPSVKIITADKDKGIYDTYMEAKNKYFDKAITGALLASEVVHLNDNGNAGDKAATIRMYTQFKGFKEVGKLFENISFEIPFSFGQFGLFNAYKEVVAPMMAIVGLFSPHPYKNKTGDGVSLFHTPYPNSNYLTAKQAISIYGAPLRGSVTIKDDKNGQSGGTQDNVNENSNQAESPKPGVLNQFLANVEKLLLSGVLMSLSKENGAESENWKYASFRYGNFKIGPCEIQSIEPKFDFNQLDEYGFPYKGTLGIKANCLTNSVNSAIIQSFLC